MFFGPERQGKRFARSTVQFKQFRQNKADFLDHRRPGFSLDDKAGNIRACRQPNIRLAVPPRIDGDLFAHMGSIKRRLGEVNPAKAR